MTRVGRSYGVSGTVDALLQLPRITKICSGELLLHRQHDAAWQISQSCHLSALALAGLVLLVHFFVNCRSADVSVLALLSPWLPQAKELDVFCHFEGHIKNDKIQYIFAHKMLTRPVFDLTECPLSQLTHSSYVPIVPSNTPGLTLPLLEFLAHNCRAWGGRALP